MSECWGGPLDGQQTARSSPGVFKWIDDGGRTFDDPGEERFLHRRLTSRWEYIGHKARRCANCGAIVICARGSACSWCGAGGPT